MSQMPPLLGSVGAPDVAAKFSPSACVTQTPPFLDLLAHPSMLQTQTHQNRISLDHEFLQSMRIRHIGHGPQAPMLSQIISAVHRLNKSQPSPIPNQAAAVQPPECFKMKGVDGITASIIPAAVSVSIFDIYILSYLFTSI